MDIVPFSMDLAAVAQAAPAAFDRERPLDKAESPAGEAARKGARLVLFPEAFVSAHPRGMDFGEVVGARTDEGREAYCRYWESSVDVPGAAVASPGETARTHSIHLVIGVVERDGGTLAGLQEKIHAERDRKLNAARKMRKDSRQQGA